MAAFFSQVGYKSTGEWKEEIVFFDPDKAAGAAPVAARSRVPTATDGRALAPGQDPREVFAVWLIAPENPWFARAVVNRVVVLAGGPRHRPRARRHPARQSAEPIPSCWRSSSASSSRRAST